MSYSTTARATLGHWTGVIQDLLGLRHSGNLNATSREPHLPLSARSVDTSIPFSATEQLFRRVLPSEELTDGEIDLTRFNSVSFKKGVDGAPSVLRGRFSEPADALHRDCAGQKDVSNQFVYSISVGELPEEIHSDDGKHFSIYPLHLPEPTCGAHSVISSCRKGDDSGT